MSSRGMQGRLERLEAMGNQHAKWAALRVFPEWLEARLKQHGWGIPAVSGSQWRYEALPAQREFHLDLTTRFKGYSGPIGSGKSYALVYEALFLSRMNPGLLGLIGAPTYRMLEDSTQRTFFEILGAEGIDHIFNKQENRVRFPANGSEIIFRTMEAPERLRGPNLAWFALDELTYTREEAWTRLLGRLRHPRAGRLCGCVVWTPKGFDWVHRRFVEERNSDYRLVKATPQENLHLPSDFYTRLEASYNERFYRQEVLGEYLDVFGGNAYFAFSEKNVAPVYYDPNLPLCWALDFNVDPMCSVICQIEEHRVRPWYPECEKELRVLDEIVLPNSNTPAAVEEFIRRIRALPGLRYPVPIIIYGDASGNSRTTKATRTDYELIREAFERNSGYKLSMRHNTANPLVRDRVNTVNNVLRSTAGTRRAVIDPKCKELIKDLQQVRWRRDGAGNTTGDLDKSDPQRTHLSDALSYLVAQEWGLQPAAGYRADLMQ